MLTSRRFQRAQAVTEEIAESLGLDRPRGALVASVTENGPAEKAKIEAGDVILSFNDQAVDEMRELPRIVADTPPLSRVPVQFWRKGTQIELSVMLAELEEYEKTAAVVTDEPGGGTGGAAVEALGLRLSSLSDELRQRFDLDESVDGVVVTKVDAESVAARKGLREGDVIVEVGQEEVTAPDQFSDKIKKAKDDGRKSILLLVDRGGDLRFVALRVDEG